MKGTLMLFYASLLPFKRDLSKAKPDHIGKIFTRLMLLGKVGAALSWLSDNKQGALEATPGTLDVLKELHPPKSECAEGSLLFGPILKVEAVLYCNIDASAIAKAARLTKGGAGPSNVDADMWRTLLCAKSGGKTTDDLCHSVAKLAQRLASDLVNPAHVDSILNCRLIPLGKNPGVSPIGIGEVLRRIIGKAVTQFSKADLAKSVGPLQVSAGLEGGCEAAIHAMRDMYNDDDTQGVLFVDASNAFNRINRQIVLHNVQRLCPIVSTYLINTYRTPCKLFLASNNIGLPTFIWSSEGTTQGDPLASSFYSTGTIPIINHLQSVSDCPQNLVR